MIYYCKFLFSFFLHVIFIHAGFIPDKLFNGTVMHLERFNGQCGRNSPDQMIFQGVKTVSTKIIINNCTLIVKEGGSKDLMATITIHRCQSKENLDTCEQYIKRSNIDYCKMIDPDNFISKQSPLFIPFEPPVKCPIKKGVYQAYNVSLDLTPFIFFKVEDWYWKVKYQVFNEHNKLVFCTYIEGYITNPKSRKN